MENKTKGFLVIETATRNTKQRKVPVHLWPTKTQFKCFHDSHEITHVPWPMVHHKCDPTQFIMHICVDGMEFGQPYPVFCSPNCVLARIDESNFADRPRLKHNVFVLQQMFRQYFAFATPGPSLHIVPRSELHCFGGSKQIHEFRKNFCMLLDKRPTNTIAIQQIESRPSHQDTIYWPNQYPHVVAESGNSQKPPVPLTSMDDPTDSFVDSSAFVPTDETDEPQPSVTKDSIQMVSDVVRDTIESQTIDAVSKQLQRMEIDTKVSHSKSVAPDKPRVKRQKTSSDHVVPKPLHAKSKSLAAAPSVAMASSSSSFTMAELHPMFRNRGRSS